MKTRSYLVSGRFLLLAMSVSLLSLAMPAAVSAQFGGGQPIPKAPSQFDELMRVVMITVASDTWDEVGGPGSMQPVDAWGMLIVSQTTEVHEQLEDLIRAVRDARRRQSGQDAAADPNQQVSMAVDSPANEKAREKVEQALAQETELDFVETPLEEVVEYLATLHDVPTYLDKRAMDDIGLGADTPVTISLKGVSLRSALRIMLKELELTYIMRDEVLQITTREQAESSLITRIYLVEDLAVPPKPIVPTTAQGANSGSPKAAFAGN